jgi:hypothetical protein
VHTVEETTLQQTVNVINSSQGKFSNENTTKNVMFSQDHFLNIYKAQGMDHY